MISPHGTELPHGTAHTLYRVDIDRDEISDEDVKWDDDVIKDLEMRFNKLREFNEIWMKVLWMKVPTRIL